MKRNNKLYVQDILDSIENIEKYTKSLSPKEFKNSQIVVDAVVRNLEIIGEASKNVSLEVKSQYKKLPWKEMSGMRNKVIHEYFGVDSDIVWKTVKYSLPGLKKSIKAILRELSKK